MAVGRHNDLISTSGSDEATIMTKPSIDRKPSIDGDSWSAAVVTLHHDVQDVLNGDNTDTDMPPPPTPTPTPIMSSEKLPMKEAKPLPPAPYVVPGERSKAVSSKKNVDVAPSTVTSKNSVKNKKKTRKKHVKSTRQPRPLSPVADTLLGQPSASFSSSMHETDDAKQPKIKKHSSSTTNVKVTVTTSKKPPPPETPSYIYIEHEVLPTDTLQGLCLAYKISATRLRMENKFSGNTLILAPKILKIPIDPAKMKSLGTVEDVVRHDKIKGGLEKEEEKEVAPSKDDQGVTEEEEIPWLIKSASTAAEEEKDEEEESTFFDIDSSKRLLRELMESLSVQVDDHGGSVLTTSEYNFLQMLLESNGPGVAEACVAAHGRLMDADLFWGAIGGGGGAAPAEELRLEEENNDMITPSGAESGVYSCVSDLLSVGTSIGAMEGLDPLQYNPQYDADLGVFSDVGRDEKEGRDYKEIVVASSSGGGRDEKKGSDYGDSSIVGVPPVPAAVEETPPANNYLDSSTKDRLDRLEQRRRQSNRLLQAHEAGLVVTPGGSARRYLMRMGLPMDENLHNAPPPPRMPLSPIQDESQSKSVSSECSTEDAERQAVDEILSTLSDAVKVEDGDETIIEQATFEKALAKMDERTLRRIKKEEQKKEAKEKKKKGKIWSKETETAIARPAAPQHYAGCITPFSIGMLRRHFASKQFSIQRASSNSSSYTRFDSFLLSATETMESGFLLRHGDGYDDDDSFLDDAMNTGFLNDSIHVKKTKTSDDDRLDNLLINAGFKDAKSCDTTDTLVVDAQSEDDEDILAMSARSTNSIAMLMRGGPSYRNVDMFRADDGDVEDEKKNEIPDDAKKSDPSIQATKLSPSDAAADNGIREDPIDDDASDDDVSIPSLHSDLGELPSLLPPLAPVDRLSQSARTPRSSSRHQRRATIGIIKSSSDKNNTKKYKRSVSWNRRVFVAKEDAKVASIGLARKDSAASGMSVISFPNLAMSLPILRSDSNVSESMTSVLSPIPPLSHAHSIHSTRGSFSVAPATGPPLLSHAHSIRSDFGATMTDYIDDLSSEEDVDANPSRPDGAAWESPIVSLKLKMKGSATRPGKTNLLGGEDEDEEHPVFIHPTSKTRVYEGAGIEIEDFPQVAVVVPAIETMDSNPHEKYQNMISVIDDSVRSARSTHRFDDSFRSARSTHRFDDSFRSARSTNRFDDSFRSARSLAQRLDSSARSARTNNNSRSWNNRFLRDDSIRSSSVRGLNLSGRSRRSSYNLRSDAPPITSLDDGFIIKNIHFERHSSEILRSLSNEDFGTINGGLIHGGKPNEARSTRAISGMLSNAESWDGLEGSPSYQLMSDSAWPVLEEDYDEDCEALGPLSFRILGTSANDKDCQPHVLSPPLMESLQNFLPPDLSFTNFWLKYSLVRDGPSLPSLLRHVRSSRHTFVAIETVGGEVFGSFTSSPWRKNSSSSGANSGDLNGNKLEEAFLWRMRRTRAAKDAQSSVLDQAKLESELDVYYWTGKNNSQIQYCTQSVLAVGGGGPLRDGHDDGDDVVTENAKEECELPPKAATDGAGGFGLAIESDLQRGTSSSCAAFRNPPLSASHADGSPFEILNVEVWMMTPCANIADAEYLEMRDLFLEG